MGADPTDTKWTLTFSGGLDVCGIDDDDISDCGLSAAAIILVVDFERRLFRRIVVRSVFLQVNKS
jgi:hypothetical protein